MSECLGNSVWLKLNLGYRYLPVTKTMKLPYICFFVVVFFSPELKYT